MKEFVDTKEEQKPIIPFLIQGKGGGGEQENDQHQPIEEDEGIYWQNPDRVVSLTQIKVFDLLGEGPIEGLVEGEYKCKGRIGEIGYDSYDYEQYKQRNGVRYLRSIYWNDTPVVDSNNLYNFQDIDVGVTYGQPNGKAQLGDGFNELTVSRAINERLRGPTADIAKQWQNTSGNSPAMLRYAKVYKILNKECYAIDLNIKVSQLKQTNMNVKDEDHFGDVTATNVDYLVYYRPIFSKATVVDGEPLTTDEIAWKTVLRDRIMGKISYGYIRSRRINFPLKYINAPNFLGWEIRVLRVTAESTDSRSVSITYIDSLTEIYKSVFCYPNSAIVAQNFSAEYFSQIPARAFDVRLLKVRIPNNYDPIKKTYDGIWDGTFKTDENGNEERHWTDNPAWCFYDLITNKRYGLGKYIEESLVDKWTLYEIGRYCDTLVSDGQGGIEPRFTCNMYLTSREDAYKVVNDMASIFRAIVYYSAGSLYTSFDGRKSPVMQFTNANVENGEFTYSSSSKRVRHTVAIVHYNDKNDFYKPAVEYVEDVDGIRRYGIREIEMAAVGCTSRGQAIRWGRWALLSEKMQMDAVSFTAGMDGNYLRPGDVFKVYDHYKKGKRHGGRILDYTVSGNKVNFLLDDQLTFSDGKKYQFSLLTPSFNYDPAYVTQLNSADVYQFRKPLLQKDTFVNFPDYVTTISGKTQLSFPAQNWDSTNYIIKKEQVWSIESTGTPGEVDEIYDHDWDFYQAIRIEEKDNFRLSIAGIQYSDTKFEQIESGLSYQTYNYSLLPQAPKSITLESKALDENGALQQIDYKVTYDNTDPSVVESILIYAKNGDWATGDFTERFLPGQTPRVLQETPDQSYLVDVIGVRSNDIIPSGSYIPFENGTYHFRAYTRNNAGLISNTSASASIGIEGVDAFKSLTISSLRLASDTAEGGFENRSVHAFTSTAPTFTWQAGFENVYTPTDFGNVMYRISFRKPSYANALNKATESEIYRPTDPFSPSKIIYFQATGLTFTNDLSYTLDLQRNIEAFVTQNASVVGAYREFDVVVEAHQLDGTSSAGGNFTTDDNGYSLDSLYTNPKGYDICYVNNVSPEAITLTRGEDLEAYLGDQSKTFVTHQWFNIENEVKLSIKKGELPPDIVGGYIYTSRKPFTVNQAISDSVTLDQSFWRGVPSGLSDYIIRSEFTSLDNPITANCNLAGYLTGYMAVGFYDTFGQNIKTYAKNNNLTYDLHKNINISSPVRVRYLAYTDLSPYNFHAWAEITVSFTSNPTLPHITSIDYYGVGLARAAHAVRAKVTVNYIQETISNPEFGRIYKYTNKFDLVQGKVPESFTITLDLDSEFVTTSSFSTIVNSNYTAKTVVMYQTPTTFNPAPFVTEIRTVEVSKRPDSNALDIKIPLEYLIVDPIYSYITRDYTAGTKYYQASHKPQQAKITIGILDDELINSRTRTAFNLT